MTHSRQPAIRLGPSLLRKTSLRVGSHHTSMRIEPQFLVVLREMAADRDVSLAQLLGGIHSQAPARRFASHCRVACLDYAKAKAAAHRIAKAV